MKLFQSGLLFRLILLSSLLISFSNCEDSPETGVPEAPEAPYVEPGDGELFVAWEEAPGASSYEVWIHTLDDSKTATQAASDIREASYTVTDLENGVTYYVWIKAKNQSGASGFSRSTSAMTISGDSGKTYYYEGTVVITTKGTNDQGDSYNESVTYTGVRINEWTLHDENWWGYAYSCDALVKVDDWYGDPPKTHRMFEGQYRYQILPGDSRPDVASLHVFKTEGGGYTYSLSVSSPKSADVNQSGPMKWSGAIPEMPLDDFMPLVIRGEFSDCPWNDGVPTTVKWEFERHIKYY